MKTSLTTMKLEKRLENLLVDARKRRAYVHPLAMTMFTPKQYEYAVPWLTKHGYGPNVFPVHHVHPPLSMAIIGLHVDAATSLLRHGADPHLSYPTESGRTCPVGTLLNMMVKNLKNEKKFKKLEQLLSIMTAYGAKLDKTLYPGTTETYREKLDKIMAVKNASRGGIDIKSSSKSDESL